MKLHCTSCGLDTQDESLYVPTYRKEGEYRNKCKECHRQQGREYRTKHREKRKSLILKSKDKPCLDCNKKYPHYVMDFDHVRGEKLFNISDGYYNAALEDIEKEIKKCDVVCSNCHRERTHNRVLKERHRFNHRQIHPRRAM